MTARLAVFVLLRAEIIFRQISSPSPVFFGYLTGAPCPCLVIRKVTFCVVYFVGRISRRTAQNWLNVIYARNVIRMHNKI
jgi:hypothetical protein